MKVSGPCQLLVNLAATGEQVVVADGPFVGVEAIYQMADGEGRVMLLLNILSKQVKMTVSPASVRKVR